MTAAGRAGPGSRVQEARARMRLPVNRKVTGVLEGAYVALHPGRSTEFVDVREYVPGDDPKDIDWKASARARTLYVRRHHAHRKLTVLLAVSTGRSMAAAAGVSSKSDLAIGAAAVVGAVGVAHGDLVGLVAGDASGQRHLRPRSGAAHLERCLDAASEASTPASGASDLVALLGEVQSSARRPCLVLLVIDEVELGREELRLLAALRDLHELLVVVLDDANPFDLTQDRYATVSDVDTATPLPSWLRQDARLAAEHVDLVTRDRTELDRALGTLGLAHVHVSRPEEIVPGLAGLFDRHRRAGRR